MNGCQTVDLIVATSRASVLVIATIGGVLSIFLGWKLYKDVILSKTEGSLKTGNWTIKLAGAGPGVFFVAFGVWLLVKIVGQQVEMNITGTSDRATLTQSSDVSLNVDRPIPFGKASKGPIVEAASPFQPAASEKCPNVSCPVCLIPKSHVIRFFDGPKILSDEMARRALRTAAQSLELQAVVPLDASSPLAGVNLNEQIEVLKQMRALIPTDDSN